MEQGAKGMVEERAAPPKALREKPCKKRAAGQYRRQP